MSATPYDGYPWPYLANDSRDGEGGEDLAAEHDGKPHDVRTAGLAQVGMNPFAERAFGQILGAGDDFFMGGIKCHRS